MPKFQTTRSVASASGFQVFEVTAKNTEEATKKFRNGEARIVQSEVEVTDLHDWDFDDMEEIQPTPRKKKAKS